MKYIKEFKLNESSQFDNYIGIIQNSIENGLDQNSLNQITTTAMLLSIGGIPPTQLLDIALSQTNNDFLHQIVLCDLFKKEFDVDTDPEISRISSDDSIDYSNMIKYLIDIGNEGVTLNQAVRTNYLDALFNFLVSDEERQFDFLKKTLSYYYNNLTPKDLVNLYTTAYYRSADFEIYLDSDSNSSHNKIFINHQLFQFKKFNYDFHIMVELSEISVDFGMQKISNDLMDGYEMVYHVEPIFKNAHVNYLGFSFDHPDFEKNINIQLTINNSLDKKELDKFDFSQALKKYEEFTFYSEIERDIIELLENG